MTSPLKDPIEPTKENVKLALAELKKLGWIRSWWIDGTGPVNDINGGRELRYHIVTDHAEPTTLTTPMEVGIWIDGFLSGKGGL